MTKYHILNEDLRTALCNDLRWRGYNFNAWGHPRAWNPTGAQTQEWKVFNSIEEAETYLIIHGYCKDRGDRNMEDYGFIERGI